MWILLVFFFFSVPTWECCRGRVFNNLCRILFMSCHWKYVIIFLKRTCSSFTCNMQRLYWIVVFGMVVRCREERHSIIFSLNFSLCMYLCLGTMALTIVFLGVYLLVSLSPTFFFFFFWLQHSRFMSLKPWALLTIIFRLRWNRKAWRPWSEKNDLSARRRLWKSPFLWREGLCHREDSGCTSPWLLFLLSARVRRGALDLPWEHLEFLEAKPVKASCCLDCSFRSFLLSH